MNAEKVYSLEEQKANRKLWVEALRSGEFEQGQGTLYSGDGKYCCLGVLCAVAGLAPNQILGEDHLYQFPDVKAFVGIRDDEGAYDDFNFLANDNDDGKTFAEIADIIESEPDGLFLPVPAKSEV